MSIKLTYRGHSTIPVEVEGLTPDWAVDKSLAEIERFEIFHGNRRLPVAEIFSVTGDPGDMRIDFEGDLANVHWIGASMRRGSIHVHGSAGRHAGSEMRGGEIHIQGDASNWLGCEMRDGLIHVRGNAGDLVGAAYRGSPQGMRGGAILIDGDAGNELGLSMQQGIIAVGGRAGDMLGFNMSDGTIIILGESGIRAGAEMRAGTIAMLGPTPPPVLPSFRFDRQADPESLKQTLLDLRAKGLRFEDTQIPSQVSIYVGDLISEGTGELQMRHAVTS